jgi:hypothetical protein
MSLDSRIVFMIVLGCALIVIRILDIMLADKENGDKED